jgi:hypothetical protein
VAILSLFVKQSGSLGRAARVGIRKRGEFLGFVEAPDQGGGRSHRVVRFNLSEEQRGRLVAQEQV